jgi:hypothetical protein
MTRSAISPRLATSTFRSGREGTVTNLEFAGGGRDSCRGARPAPARQGAVGSAPVYNRRRTGTWVISSCVGPAFGNDPVPEVKNVTSSVKIKKSQVPVVIYTATHRIEGFYHALDNGGRLLDDLNDQGRHFIPVTDARVTKLQSEGETVVSKFLAVNLLSITLFFRNPKVVGPAAGRQWVESSVVPDLLIGAVKPPVP